MYKEIINKVEALVDKNIPLVSNLSNLSTMLYDEFKGTSWFGFYLVLKEEDVLYLGPYKGPLACTKIKFNKGVCGISAYKKETIIVSDVSKFDSYIACSSEAKSEIVTPIIKKNQVVALIDIDSPIFNRFSNEDRIFLEQVASLLANLF